MTGGGPENSGPPFFLPTRTSVPLTKHTIAIDFWDGLTGACSNRHGGGSEPPFDTLNLSYGVGDRAERVQHNRQTLKTALGLSTLLSARQIHGDSILSITAPVPADHEFDGHDALITNQPGVGIMIQQADCQAVVLYDPTNHVVANIHAGWRGSVVNLPGKTVSRLMAEFGTEPSQVKAAISPSLGPCCAQFINFRDELPDWFHPFQTMPAHFDFWAITRQQLQAAGVPANHIQTIGICTRCDTNYFSYRREGRTGRSATVVALR